MAETNSTYFPPSSGGGDTLYSTDGMLAGFRTVDLDNKFLKFDSAGFTMLQLVPDIGSAQQSVLIQTLSDTDDGNTSTVYAQSQAGNSQVELEADFNDGTNVANISMQADTTDSRIQLEATEINIDGENFNVNPVSNFNNDIYVSSGIFGQSSINIFSGAASDVNIGATGGTMNFDATRFIFNSGNIEAGSIPQYANRTAAMAGGLTAGQFYSLPIAGDNKVICIV